MCFPVLAVGQIGQGAGAGHFKLPGNALQPGGRLGFKLNDVCQQRFLKGESVSHESLIPLLDNQAHKNAPALLAAADNLNLALNPVRRYAASADQVAHHDLYQLAAGRRF